VNPELLKGIAEIPKTALHVHIDGTLEPELAFTPREEEWHHAVGRRIPLFLSHVHCYRTDPGASSTS
jgi:hypothetical protein